MTMPKNDWRVIGRDNQSREHIADIIKVDGVTEAQARDFAGRLNEDSGEHASRWYIAQPMSEQMWRGMEELL